MGSATQGKPLCLWSPTFSSTVLKMQGKLSVSTNSTWGPMRHDAKPYCGWEALQNRIEGLDLFSIKLLRLVYFRLIRALVGSLKPKGRTVGEGGPRSRVSTQPGSNLEG